MLKNAVQEIVQLGHEKVQILIFDRFWFLKRFKFGPWNAWIPHPDIEIYIYLQHNYCFDVSMPACPGFMRAGHTQGVCVCAVIPVVLQFSWSVVHKLCCCSSLLLRC